MEIGGWRLGLMWNEDWGLGMEIGSHALCGMEIGD